jgi:hypothetical protein
MNRLVGGFLELKLPIKIILDNKKIVKFLAENNLELLLKILSDNPLESWRAISDEVGVFIARQQPH